MQYDLDISSWKGTGHKIRLELLRQRLDEKGFRLEGEGNVWTKIKKEDKGEVGTWVGAFLYEQSEEACLVSITVDACIAQCSSSDSEDERRRHREELPVIHILEGLGLIRRFETRVPVWGHARRGPIC